jgi:phosphate transport system substrate-binding protein
MRDLDLGSNGFGRAGRSPIAAGALGLLLVWAIGAWAGPVGRIVIAGYGPEFPVMQDLAKAFEKAHPGTAVEFEWEKNVKALDRVRGGDAQIAVSDQEAPDLKATPIAWDGIAVIVNFTNPVTEVTSENVKRLFTGRIRRWTDLNATDANVIVIDRTPYDNVKPGFEEALGIVGQVQAGDRVVRTDERVLRAVSGQNSAVSYLSLASALKAQADGVPVRVLTIDKVEPAEPTVKDGRYKLRRPVLLLTSAAPDPVTAAFLAFALSPEGQRIVQSTFVPYVPPPAAPKEAKFPPPASGG